MTAANGAVAECGRDFVDLRWSGGKARFAVEIADSDASRSQGLMFRESMPRYSGMLFVYPYPQPVSFWMKNTLIPLDMIFLDHRGKVITVHENAVPGDLRSIFGGNDILAVLEINGGLAGRLGLASDAEMRHPTFEENNALWSCQESSQ